MGKFDLNYTEAEIIPFVQPVQHNPAFRFVTVEGRNSRDSGFQKGVCYASYYVMTFTAMCAFLPGQVAHAAEVVISILPL